MALHPQDIVILLKLVSAEAPVYSVLANSVGLSVSQVHSSVRRARTAGLLDQSRKPNRVALYEFLAHGLKYVFPPQRGGLTRGIPTAHAAPPLNNRLRGNDDPVVWPDPKGEVRGEALTPLHKSAKTAARNDPRVYELLALVDAVRAGRAREREIAKAELKKRLLDAPARS